MISRRSAGGLLVVLVTLHLAAPAPAWARSRGLVLERPPADSALGLTPGDVLLSWEHTAPSPGSRRLRGDLADAFDLLEAEFEHAPRGGTRLEVLRNGRKFWVALPLVDTDLDVRPSMPEAVLAPYREGRRLFDGKEWESGLGQWRRAAEEAETTGNRPLACWLHYKAGLLLARVGARYAAADAAYAEALRVGEGAVPGLKLAHVWDARAKVLRARNEFKEAVAGFRTARRLRGDDDRRLLATDDLHYIADVYKFAGDVEAAAEHFGLALAAQRRIAPQSVNVGRSLTFLGEVRRMQGRLAEARPLVEEAIALEEKVAPGSLALASSLQILGLVLEGMNDPATEVVHQRALAIRRERAPGTFQLATSLNSMGNMAQARGDLVTAEKFYRESLAIREQVAPGTVSAALGYYSLGAILAAKGDLDEAEVLEKKALDIYEQLVPDRGDVALALQGLGSLAIGRERWEAADAFYSRALAIQSRIKPDSPDTSYSLRTLAFISLQRGRLDAAEDYALRAQALRAKNSLQLTVEDADLLAHLGAVARARGDLVTAERLLRRAAEVGDEAQEWLGLGLATAGFKEYAGDYHGALVQVLFQTGRTREAYEALERSRGRRLLGLLAQRERLAVAADPVRLVEQQRLDAEYDEVQAALVKVDRAQASDEASRLLARLQELREARDRLVAPRSEAGPAGKRAPSLDLPGVRAALDPGTVLLAYSLQPERALLFVVESQASAGSGLTVFDIPAANRKVLEEQSRTFRELIRRHDERDRPELAALGKRLYRTLISPAEAIVARSGRVLVVPDGSLHTLPFAALVREAPEGKGMASQYFVEWRPVHQIVSATVYAQVKNARRSSGSGGKLVAFGDPQYPKLSSDEIERVPDQALRSALRRWHDLDAVPGTRDEVEQIARQAPGSATVFVGSEATEDRAKALGTDARYVHFACHGLVDEGSPLDSGLALTIPREFRKGQANGLLQVWEVFQDVHLDADLVTLSACETGLGKETQQDGLIGLTRAFQYAGARSVLASLWSVSDRSTAGLMEAFYARLFKGQAKDESLRQAQLELLRSREYGHPFYWSAFQLYGDWR